MVENDRLSRNQERFLQQLLLGKSIVASAKFVGIGEATAFRWLSDPAFKAERDKREAAIAEAEQAEIERILTTGYAAIHKRVEALDKLAKEMEEPYQGLKGNEYGLRNSPDHIREWRGLLDDIAKELGQRVTKTKQEVSGSIDINGARDRLLQRLETLPDDDSSTT